MLEVLNDCDWQEAFGYAGDPESTCVRFQGGPRVETAIGDDAPPHVFSREDVDELRHLRPGDHDGPEWLAVGRLRDGRWFFLAAGCDYTGWDCQAGGFAVVASSYEHLMQFGVPDDYRRELLEPVAT